MSTSSWSLTVRLSSGDRFNVEMPSTCSVGAAKALIQAAKSELTASRQRLVYKGRILDDDSRLLSDYGVVDQSTVFLVLSSASSSTGSNARTSATLAPVAPPAPSPSPYSAAVPNQSSSTNTTTGATQFPHPFGMPGAGFPGMANPESMREMMNSPMMQGLLDNPEMMQAAMQMTLQTNPQLRQLLDSNPELRQVFNDPAMMQQAMQMMRNPAAMQQAMRSQELAMSQLENIPGGFSALSSMYRNLQEPLMEAQEMRSEPTSARSQPSSGEGATGAPMPNPWGTSSAQRTSTTTPSPLTSTSTGMSMSTGPANPWAQGAIPGMGQPPNPEQLMQVLDNPIMMNMMQQMVDQNPDMIRQMMEAQNPMMRQMFQNNPEQANQFIRQMMNPQNLRNMLQVQRAMGGTMPGMPPATAGLDFSNLLGSSSPSSAPPPLDFGAMLQQMQVGSSPMAGGVPPLDIGPFLQQMQGTSQQQQQQHPADRFRPQLQSLRDMGFDDEQACLAALQQNHGNLNRAVDQLLMSPPVPTSAPPPPVASAPASQPPPEGSNDVTPKPADDKKND